MIRKSRNLVLDVFDYSNHKLCTLYDNSVDTSGQAHDVFIITERNGWRELSFDIPSTINTAEGVEPNYRLDYIKPDYKIRAIDDDGPDWFLISEPTQTHKGKSKDIAIKAGHISQLLKTKNLGLEFSDKEGNNVGTAAELLTTILDGTGWKTGYVDTFYEKDGTTIKKRSMKASAKTGAFKLISNMCALFDAKPIYHGDERTVDIVPMNPFSKPVNGDLPDVTKADGVIELAYSKNVTNVSRKENSENLATKLYAYGSYGDQDNGYCGIDECVHKEFIYTITAALSADTKYYFSYVDDSGTTVYRNFTPDRTIPSGSKIIFSLLDPASQMYVWIEAPAGDTTTFGNVYQTYWYDSISGILTNDEWTQLAASCNINGHAYLVDVGQSTTALPCTSKTESVQNWFSFLMDFEYFRDVNLLSDYALQKIAGYQRFAASCYQTVYAKSMQMTDGLLELSETIGEVDFCKLDVAQIINNGGNVCVKLNKTTHSDGIIYRSDYLTNTKEHFVWTPSPEIKTNGDPKTTGASMLFIVHNTTPTTWTKGYLKAMDDKDDPTDLTFHIDYSDFVGYNASDKYFLFKSNSINGRLGGLEINDEANTTAINNQTKVVTVNHNVQFGQSLPIIVETSSQSASSIMDNDPAWYKIDNYGWFWKFDYSYGTESELYFCYYDHYGTGTEQTWRRVRFQSEEPTAPTGGVIEYWFDWDSAVLYRYMNSTWTALTTDNEKKVAAMFGPVYKACRTRDEYYKGSYERYTYTVSSETLAGGNYFIQDGYDGYHVFSLKEALEQGDTLSYSTDDRWIVIAKNGTLEPVSVDLTMEAGTIDNVGILVEDTTKCRSANYISVTPGQSYTFTGLSNAYPLTLYKYNASHELVERIDNLSGYDGTFTAQTGVTSIKLTCDLFYQIFNQFSSFKLLLGQKKVIETKAYRFDNVGYLENSHHDDSVIVIQEENYTKLTPIMPSGNLIGIVTLTKKFADLSDTVYITYYNAYTAAQQALTDMDTSLSSELGDMYREGFWQKKDYINGDETKLYDDAVDIIKEISKPKATYNVTYLDQYGIQEDETNGASELTAVTMWPDLTTSSAAHLVDPEININCWAYIDKVNKCYDKPWQTTISINTELSTMTQHTFADVMTNIADVANAVKAKEELIDRAQALTDRGTLAAKRLQGAIDANKLEIFGGSSTWYTDDKGNMVFESADSKAAMTLTGAGFAIANTKDVWGDWNWRTFGTGDGFIANEIVAGRMSGELLEVRTVYADRLAADVGTYIDISQNDTIQIVSENIAKKSTTYTQWTDPVLDVSNNVQVGDLWDQRLPYDTWQSVSDLTWQDMNDYPAWAFVGSRLHVRKHNPETDLDEWVIITDPIDVMEAKHDIVEVRSEVEVTNDRITLVTSRLSDRLDQAFIQLQPDNIYLAVQQTTGYNSDLSSKYTVQSGISIESTGITITGSKYLNLESGATIDIKTGSGLTVESGGNIDVSSGGSISVKSANSTTANAVLLNNSGISLLTNGTFTVHGGNFSIDASGNVTMTGQVQATTGQIANWSIDSGLLKSGSGTTFVALDSNTSDTYAIWAGANDPVTTDQSNNTTYAPFSVQRSGFLRATSGLIGGWSLSDTTLSSGSGNTTVALSTSGSYAFWAGNATASSAVFSVKNDGEMKATLGTVGGWTINAYRLSAGTGTDTVALNSAPTTVEDENSSYAIWAGAANAQNTPSGEATVYAPFSVKKDGTVYLTKLIAVGSDGTGTTTINLSQYPLWKLSYATVKSISSTSSSITIVTTAGSHTANFNTAASVTVQGSWSGVKYTVQAYDGGGSAISGASASTTIFATDTSSISWVNHQTTVSVWASGDGGFAGPLYNRTIDATSQYEAGVTYGTAVGEGKFSVAGSYYWGYSTNGGATWNPYGSATLYRKTG